LRARPGAGKQHRWSIAAAGTTAMGHRCCLRWRLQLSHVLNVSVRELIHHEHG
jgi:hypothetical protein